MLTGVSYALYFERIKFMKNRITGEIEIQVLENMLAALSKLNVISSADFTLLIHGMGSQTRSFYRELRTNESVEVIWSGWCSKVWWSYLFSFIPGQAGLVKVLDRKKLNPLYLEIGAQSMCGLYFVPNKKVEIIIDKVINERSFDVSDILKDEKNYFLLVVDFDYRSETRDGEVYYRDFIVADNVGEEVKTLLQ